MGFTELWKINFVQHWHLTSARQQLSFKNHAREKPETTEKQPNRHWRGTEDTPTVCTEAKERHGTHKKQKHMCNHQAIQEILNWVESSKLERILRIFCIWFYLGENHLSSKPTMEVSALWWELIKKERKPFSFSGQPISLKQKVQHASAQGDYGGLLCLYHSLLSALGVGVCISLSRHL